MAKDFGKTYYAYFYTTIDAEGQWEQHQGTDVINVGISTNPRKMLREKQRIHQNRDLLVLLVKETKESDFNNLLKEIEELRTYKTWYEFAPLAGLLKRKCLETGYEPHKMKSKKALIPKQDDEVYGQLPL